MSRELAPLDSDPDPVPLPAVVSTNDLVAAFLDGRKPSTVAGYRKDLADFSRWRRPCAPSVPAVLAELLALEPGPANLAVLLYRNAMLARNLASATIARRLAALRSFTKLSRTLGRISWSIEVEAPRAEPRRDVSGPSPAELRKFVKAGKRGDCPRDKRDRAVVALLLGLGLRRAEVVGVDREDLDFKTSKIQVLGKGKREKLALEMPPEVADRLGQWALARGDAPGPLFTRLDRPGSLDRLTGEAVRRLVRRLGVAAGVEKPVRPHGLRHSAITGLLESGESHRDVLAFSRHKKMETLMRYDDTLKKKGGSLAAKAAKALR